MLSALFDLNRYLAEATSASASRTFVGGFCMPPVIDCEHLFWQLGCGSQALSSCSFWRVPY